jgi:hypothetical protein
MDNVKDKLKHGPTEKTPRNRAEDEHSFMCLHVLVNMPVKPAPIKPGRNPKRRNPVQTKRRRLPSPLPQSSGVGWVGRRGRRTSERFARGLRRLRAMALGLGQGFYLPLSDKMRSFRFARGRK